MFLIVCVHFTCFADFFQSVEVRQSMINILFVYAKIHPDISYKQVTGIVFLEKKNDVIFEDFGPPDGQKIFFYLANGCVYSEKKNVWVYVY